MSKLINKYRSCKLIENWYWVNNNNPIYNDNNILLYPIVYHKNFVDDIYYINEYALVYAPNKKTTLYIFHNLFIEDNYLQDLQ
jgi:hypothetical protein